MNPDLEQLLYDPEVEALFNRGHKASRVECATLVLLWRNAVWSHGPTKMLKPLSPTMGLE